MNTDERRLKKKRTSVSICAYLWIVISVLLAGSCSEFEKPKTEPFYAQTAPPQKKEFRWSNGKMPKSFDPALAGAAPETDVVRAVFEGLTDTNAKTLEAVPAIAEKWTSSEDFKTWTFTLRKDAKWSNGERVTAKDFLRSWKRLAEMGTKVSHPQLLENIVGMQALKPQPQPSPENKTDNNLLQTVPDPNLPILNANTNPAPTPGAKLPATSEKQPVNPTEKDSKDKTKDSKDKSKPAPEPVFGVEVVNDFTLRVSLNEADKDFPLLVAHPMFRPIYGDGKDFEDGKLNAGVVTNGAFRIASVGQDGITLDRSENFWGKDKIELERVRFVPQESAEKALEAYRKGEIDAVTNADFEPLVLKLLEPYNDFKRNKHSALNFYEINRKNKPFDDRRVREALAIAIERERLTEIEMDGSTQPALSFLPFDDETGKKLAQDKERAKELLAEAGFEDGEDFPVVRLVVNRNDTQLRIAKSVVKMWKQALNIDTIIIPKEASEIEAVRQRGEYDILRRGVVLPTADEAAGLTAIFKPVDATQVTIVPLANTTPNAANLNSNSNAQPNNSNQTPSDNQTEPVPPAEIVETKPILTEEEAMTEIPAIPLYFPTSYLLVKPYIHGFEINSLDAPSLKDVRIDNNWQPKKPNGES